VLAAILVSGVLVAISVGATALSIVWPVHTTVASPEPMTLAAASEPLPAPAAETAPVPVEEQRQPEGRVARRRDSDSDFPRRDMGGAALEEARRAAQERRLRAQQAQLEAWAHREAQASMAEDDERARRRSPAQRAATATGGGPVAITMYSASWCHVCSSARTYLLGAGIPFTERDIDDDPSARATLLGLNPRGSVPTFDIGGRTMVGFSAESLNGAIAAARR
jgi:glutaredoxin